MNTTTSECGFCGLSDPNLRRCARCQCISYCSKEHQKVHWKIHKKQCAAPPVSAENTLLSPVSRSALENPVVLSGISGKSFNNNNFSSHGINEGKIHYKGSDKNSSVAINLDEKFAATSRELPQQQQSEMENLSQNEAGKNSSSKRTSKKSKSASLRQNGVVNSSSRPSDNSDLVVENNELEENLENYLPYSNGKTRILNPNNTVTSNSTSPTNTHTTTNNSISNNSGLNLTSNPPNLTKTPPFNNPKTTPVAISSPLVSPPSSVDSSTPTSSSSSSTPTLNDPGNGNHRNSITDSLSSCNKQFPFLHRNCLPTSPQQRNHWVLQICRQVISDMDNYGICVVDNLLGEERGELVYNEVQSLYTSGSFTDGQVVKEGGGSHAVRGDKITWIDGREPKCENIAFLIHIIDSIVIHANKLKDNGKLGTYTIQERTKAMVACYPGSGTHYVKHVDNPNQDGRCVTSIYYLNKDWDTKEYGGLLRIFPEGWINQVADIEPLFDRVLFFWSDRRNPHEVQPAYKTRYAITLWYFDSKEREEARSRGQIQP